jgi:hypothetical protein
MNTNYQSKSRYLFAYSFFSDELIHQLQIECQKKCVDREKGKSYEKFMQWQRAKNEMAIFTLYAWADLDIPKKLDCIFRQDNPVEHIITNFEITQSIWEAWYPTERIDKGHKHLCVFSFEDKIPDLMYLLHEEKSTPSTIPSNQIMLGFCSSEDFAGIVEYLNQKEIETD